MRNSKKLIAVILTVVLLASMMVPALAVSYQAEADKLTNAGLMNGTPGTGLNTLLTRAQGITFTVRAMGKEKAAIAMTAGAIALQMAKVKDFAAVPGWVTNFAAYAIQEKITNGNRLNADGMITFSAADPLSGRQFITMMLRALGYTGITLDNCLDKAVSVGMLSASKAIMFGSKAQLLRDDAAYIIWSTVNNGLVAMAGGVTPSAITLVYKLVADGAITVTAAAANFMFVAPTPTPAPVLSVSTVTATNLKEIVVKFNAMPDKTTAEMATNYTLSTGTVSKAVLVGDTVTLTLMANASQQASLDVTVKNVKSAAGVVMAEVTKNVVMFDVTLPTFVSYVFTGPQTIELTYSEPIKTSGTATLDNGIYGASTAVSTTKNNVIVVSLGTSIPVGVHTLKMVGVQDYAYTAIDATMSITYVANTVAPTVMISKATQTSVTLTFSKDVTGLALLNFYHTYTSYKPLTVKDTAGAAVLVGNYYNEVVLDFSNNPLPAGISTVVVLKAVDTVKITDRWGNVMAADAMLSASTTADLIAPTATVEATAETTVVVSFSEDVTFATATAKANYVFKKASDGTVVTPAASAITYNATGFKATITFAALAGGSYTVAISGIKDASLNANTITTVTLPFIVSDKTPIISANAIAVETTTTGADYIYVTYPELMMTSGVTSILNLDNYKIGMTPDTAVALPAGSTITVFGTNDKVKITVAGVGAADVTGKTLYVRNLADAAGNVMTSLYIPIALIADVAPAITAVKTTALNKLDFTVDKQLSSVAASNIIVKTSTTAAAVAVAFATYVNNTNGTATISVILTAPEALANEGTTPAAIAIAGTDIKSLTGLAMTPNTNILSTIIPTDGVAPVFVKYNQIDGATVIAQYTESLSKAYLSLGTFTVADHTVTAIDTVTALDGATPVVNSKYVKLTLAPVATDSSAVTTVTQATAVKDVALNSLAAASAVVAVDLWNPTATVPASGLTNSAIALVVTYTEPLYNLTTAIADGTDIKALYTKTGAVITSATYNATNKTVTFGLASTAGSDTITATAALKDAAGNAINTNSDVATYTTLWTIN